MDQNIINILKAGIAAPSGENTQPWRFEIKNREVRLFNRPNQDQSLYNWGQRASYMANGAVIENMVIAGSHFGLEAKVSLFSETNNENLVASIEFIDSPNIKKDSLYEYIFERTTNRKPYKDMILLEEEVSGLTQGLEQNNVHFHFTQDKDKKQILGRAGSMNEEVMLSNEYLHNFFFSHINWTKEEDNRNKVGFFIDTLELPAPARFSFSIVKSWPIMNLLNKVNMNKVVGKQNGETNAKASGFGVLSIPDLSKENFVQAGRDLERIWLNATRLGLSLQPLTGILFFMQRVFANDTARFSANQIKKIEETYNTICKMFNISNNEKIVFMFRIGKGEEPTARSVRFSLEEIIQTTQ